MGGAPDSTRYLGVDLGSRRIGLALGSPGSIVSALKVVPAAPRLTDTVRLILEALEEYAADGVVIGLPLNMDGSEGPQARQSRALARAMRQTAPTVRVYLHDERLTSHSADQELAQRSLSRKQKKRRQDAVAARVLLESFFAAEVRPEPF